MSASQLLQQLKTAGVSISRRGESLWAEPRHAVTPALVEKLRAHKTELLAMADELRRLFDAYADRSGFSGEDRVMDFLPMLADPCRWIGYLKDDEKRVRSAGAQCRPEPQTGAEEGALSNPDAMAANREDGGDVLVHAAYLTSAPECRGCRNHDSQLLLGRTDRRIWLPVCKKGHAMMRVGYRAETLEIAPPDCNDYDNTALQGVGVYR